MEKDLKDMIELLIYRLIKAGRRQRNAKSLILEYGGKHCNMDFAKESLQNACTEAGEIRDELFYSVVLPESRKNAISNEGYCNEFEMYIQKIWSADQQICTYSREIVETENQKLEAYLRERLAECQKKLENLKLEIVSHLMSGNM